MHLTIKPIQCVNGSDVFIEEYLESKVESSKKSTDSGFDLPLPYDIVVPKIPILIDTIVSCENSDFAHTL